jgi:hypothetical protein
MVMALSGDVRVAGPVIFAIKCVASYEYITWVSGLLAWSRVSVLAAALGLGLLVVWLAVRLAIVSQSRLESRR